MKHRRLAAAGLLALAVTFGVTGAANATDDAPTLTAVAGTITCTAVHSGNVQVKDGVITVDGKEVAAVRAAEAVPALPGKPGAPGDLGEAGVAVAVAPLPDEPGKLATTVTIAEPVPGQEPAGPIKMGELTAVPASPMPVPPGEIGTTMARPALPEGASFGTATGGEGKASFDENGPKPVEGASVVCFNGDGEQPEPSETPTAPEE
ncbi:hypothetical protein [Herbidospora sp. RD11066]